MRTSVDLPDSLFKNLKMAAAQRGVSMKSVIVTAVEKELIEKQAAGHRVKFPLIPRKGRKVINLTNAQIEDLLT